MNFCDDECRVCTDHPPANFATIKHMALNLLRRKSSGKKDSIKTRRFVASWDDGYWQVSLGVEFLTRFPWCQKVMPASVNGISVCSRFVGRILRVAGP